MAAETLVPANAEAGAIAELNARLPAFDYGTISVATMIPAVRPAEFIRLYRTGGVPEDIAADSVTLLVEAYSDKKARAERWCAFAVAAIQAAGRDGSLGSVPCRRVVVFSLPVNLPDPDVPGFRYTSTISVVLRRTTV